MYGAGPATRPGETAASFGLIIIRAKDETDARRIADSDPMHASGVRKYELYAWSLNEGRINVTLNFSDRDVRLCVMNSIATGMDQIPARPPRRWQRGDCLPSENSRASSSAIEANRGLALRCVV